MNLIYCGRMLLKDSHVSYGFCLMKSETSKIARQIYKLNSLFIPLKFTE